VKLITVFLIQKLLHLSNILSLLFCLRHLIPFEVPTVIWESNLVSWLRYQLAVASTDMFTFRLYLFYIILVLNHSSLERFLLELAIAHSFPCRCARTFRILCRYWRFWL